MPLVQLGTAGLTAGFSDFIMAQIIIGANFQKYLTLNIQFLIVIFYLSLFTPLRVNLV